MTRYNGYFTYREKTILLALLLMAGIGVVPGSAEVVTLDPGDSIQAAINGASDADMIVLNPGIYYENGITFTQNLTITANTAAGGNRENTIIDGIGNTWILQGTGTVNSLVIDNLTLRNAWSRRYIVGGAISVPGNATAISSAFLNCSSKNSGKGGAIKALDSVIVIDSVFTNCTASSDGGAIDAGNAVSVTSSIFTNCTAANSGAINSGSTVTVTDSTFTDCSASGTGSGGAIRTSGPVLVTGSTFTKCSATMGGAIYSFDKDIFIDSSVFTDCSGRGSGGAIVTRGSVVGTSTAFTNCSSVGTGGAISAQSSLTITDSTFTNVTATGASGSGGALYTDGTATVTGSRFTNCLSSRAGGAIYGAGMITVDSSIFTNCSASDTGGAILASNPITVTGSTFTNCSADSGGAISANAETATVRSSAFANCSATESGGSGGAIWVGNTGTTVITSSTFSGCSANKHGGAISGGNVTATSCTVNGCASPDSSAIYASDGTIRFCRLVGNPGTAVRSSAIITTITATHNWWGSNDDPLAQVSGTISSPWLVLSIIATPASITTSQTSVTEANLTYDSDGNSATSEGISLPDGIPVAFTIASGPGSISPDSAGTLSGISQTTFTPASVGTAFVDATVDGQTVSVPIEINGGEQPIVLPGQTNPPTDPDGDGKYEDLNGNAELDFNDVILYFNDMEWIEANEPVSLFDYNGNSEIDFNDVITLFSEV